MDKVLGFGRMEKSAKNGSFSTSTKMLGFGPKETHANYGILAALNEDVGFRAEGDICQ